MLHKNLYSYCQHASSMNNIFCDNQKSNSAPILSHDDLDSLNSNRKTVYTTGSNDTALTSINVQDQQVKNVLNNQNNFLIPLSPSQNVHMNINQQNIQFNIKY